MNPIFELEIEDSTKAKKTAYTISTAILLLSVLELRSDEIDLLGLVVVINKIKIILILKFFLIVTAMALVAKLTSNTLGYYNSYIERKLEAESEKDADELHIIDSKGEEEGPEPNGYEIYFYDRSVARKKHRRLAGNITEAGQLAVNTIAPNIALSALIVVAIFFSGEVSSWVAAWAASVCTDCK